MEGMNLEHKHGKNRVRVARVWKTESGHHLVAEWIVNVTLLSDCIKSYVSDDNSDIVATDTMKNIVYAMAKECSQQISLELFAILLAKHFTSFYHQVTTSIIKIVEKPWERVYVDGEPHEHGFKLGREKHTSEAIVKKCGFLQLTSGIEGLSVLKTTMSGFEGFINDEYTTLPETQERILATEISASWRYCYGSILGIPNNDHLRFTEKCAQVKQILINSFFGPPRGGVYSPSVQRSLFCMASAVLNGVPDISAISLKMPNLHFLPVNMSSKGGIILKFNNDVYAPTDEPHGTIEAELSRIQSKM